MKKAITLACIICYALTTHAQSTGDYRSIRSGYWDVKNTWQRYDGSTWKAATTYPTSSDGVITVSDTTIVSITSNLTLDQVIVAAGGELDLSSSQTITLNDAAGDDIAVYGELNWEYATFTGTGNIKIIGNLYWLSGDLKAPLINTGTTDIEGSIYIYSSLTNNGIINWADNSINFNGGAIINNAVFNALSNDYFYQSGSGSFTNAATGVFNQNSTQTYSRVTFNNNGLMNFNAGTFYVDEQTFINKGVLNFNYSNFENDATTNFEKGSSITGTGTFIQSYGTLNTNLPLTVPSTVTINFISSGTMAGSGNLKINGVMNWDNGDIKNNVTILSPGVLNIGYQSVSLYAAITNGGTVNCMNYIYFHTPGTITNNKTFNIYNSAALKNSDGVFTNNSSGTFTKMSDGENMISEVTFNNNGTLKINPGEFYNDGNFTNTGIINFSGGNFENVSTSNFNAGSSFTGNGSVLASNNNVNINASVTIPAGVNFDITSNGEVAGAGPLKISGNMYWYGGSLKAPVTVLNTGTLYIEHNSVYLYSTITNNGTVDWLNTNIYFNNGSITNNAAFNIGSNYQFVEDNSGTFINSASGIVTKSSFGTTTSNIPFTNSGTIKGAGIFDFGTNLTNMGTFAPGIDAATGILTTGADYKNKTLYIEMDSALPGIGYDRLLVNGNVTLGNDTLNVTTSGSMPAGSYVVLKWSGKRTGAFKVTHLPAGYSITYQANKVLVNVPAGFTAESAQQSNADVIKSNTNISVLAVYPNPATQIININYQPKNKNAMLQIFDANGKPVLQKNITPGISNSININRLAAGDYLAQVNDGEITRSVKFVKQ